MVLTYDNLTISSVLASRVLICLTNQAGLWSFMESFRPPVGIKPPPKWTTAKDRKQIRVRPKHERSEINRGKLGESRGFYPGTSMFLHADLANLPARTLNVYRSL